MCSPCQDEDLSLHPQDPHTKAGTDACSSKPGTGKAELESYWGFLASHSSQIVESQLTETLSQKLR